MRYLMWIPFALTACAGAQRPAVKAPPAAQQPSTPLDPAVRFSVSQQAFVVARAMVADCLAQERIQGFATRAGRLPVVKVVPSLLLQSGSIDPLVLEKLVESELINSGKVRVLGAASMAQSEEGVTVEVPERSPRADFVITVAVAALQPTPTDRAVVVTTLELVDLQQNQKVWMKVHRAQDAARVGARPATTLDG
jgi:hypothetical protein